MYTSLNILGFRTKSSVQDIIKGGGGSSYDWFCTRQSVPFQSILISHLKSKYYIIIIIKVLYYYYYIVCEINELN